MRICVVCSNEQHPVFDVLRAWCAQRGLRGAVHLHTTADELEGGDLLFLVSCSDIITEQVRARYLHSLVIHASDLPRGRGWSPLVWQMVEGAQSVTVTLLEAAEPLDSGRIWQQRTIHFEGHELHDEIHRELFSAETALMDWALENHETVVPTAQMGEPTYYRKRGPEDSRLDPDSTLAQQFDLMRVADPQRYPCFFDLRGHRYRVMIEKLP